MIYARYLRAERGYARARYYWVPGLGSDHTAVGVCEIGPDLDVRIVWYPRYGCNHNSCTGGNEKGQEKNWLFFEHQGRLYFLYDTVPFEVVEYDLERDSVRSSMRTYPEASWFWGKIRGGTPPVEVGDRYFSFFHSSLRHQGRWLYYAGVLTFAAEIPFHIDQISTQPLLAGQWEPSCAKSVIFPGGAVQEDGWTIACGINDRRCEIFTFGKDEIKCHLQKSRLMGYDCGGNSSAHEKGK